MPNLTTDFIIAQQFITPMKNNEENSIEVLNLTKIYDSVKAINNLNFTIKSGQVTGFLGPNGAGKSTTLRILSGLIPATSGIARIHNISVSQNPRKVKEIIGYMPENNPLPEDIRVIEYLRLRARLKGIPYRNQKKSIERVLELCDLSHSAEKKIIRTLSKGYRQRVGIADCLLGEPKVIIMDEPTIGLDPHQVLSIRKLIKNLRGKMTIMVSSHILPEIEASCDQMIIINRGHIVAQGTYQGLRQEFTPESLYKILIKAPESELKYLIQQIDPHMSLKLTPMDREFCWVYVNTIESPKFGDIFIEKVKNKKDWQLREIYREEPKLEDIFIAATRPKWNAESSRFKQQAK